MLRVLYPFRTAALSETNEKGAAAVVVMGMETAHSGKGRPLPYSAALLTGQPYRRASPRPLAAPARPPLATPNRTGTPGVCRPRVPAALGMRPALPKTEKETEKGS